MRVPPKKEATSIGATKEGKPSPGVIKVKNYKHRYAFNPAGQELAVVAFRYAIKMLDQAEDIIDATVPAAAHTDAGWIVRGCWWILNSAASLMECELIGGYPLDETGEYLKCHLSKYSHLDRKGLRATKQAEAREKAMQTA